MSIEPHSDEAPQTPTAGSRKRQLSLCGLASAAGCLVCVFTVTGFAGRWNWLFEITSHFRVQYAVLLLGFGLVAVWQRQRRLASAFFTFAALNTWLLLPYLFGSPALAATSSTPPVRLLAWNVHSVNRNFAELSRLINEHDPDLVVLLEVSPDWQVFLQDSMTDFPHRLIEAREDNFGIAVLSRHPLEALRLEYLGAAGLPSVSAGFVSGGQEISLLATHPLPPAGGLRSKYRDDQLRAAAKWTREQAGEVAVVGDLNITPWSPVFVDLLEAAGLHNSAEGRGLGGSWPAFFAPLLIPIDHFLHTDDVLVTRREILTAEGSDHLPLFVEFGLR